MSDQRLKPGWRIWRFEQMAYEVKDRIERPVDSGLERYVGLEHLDTGSLKIWRWGSTSDVEKQKLLFKKGDIIFGRRNAYLRRVAVADFDGVCSAHAMVLRAHQDVVLPEFLPFFMQTDGFWEAALKVSAGSMSPTINWTNIAKEEFALPPLEEQHRIAKLFWSIESLIETQAFAIVTINNLFTRFIIDSMLEYNEGKYRMPVAELLKEDPKNGYSPGTNDFGESLRTVSISAISGGKFIVDGNIKNVDVDVDKVAQFFVREDDVFIVRGNGNRYLTGKCGIATFSYEDIFYPDLLIRLRFDESFIYPRFAALQWNSPPTHRDLISNAKSTNGIWKINGQDIRKHKLIVPPLSEQAKFLIKIDEIVNADVKLRDRLKQLSKLKGRLLENML